MILLCIVGELAEWVSIALVVCIHYMWQVTHETQHSTCDTWHVTRDIWQIKRDIFSNKNKYIYIYIELLLLSAYVKRFSVSFMRDLYNQSNLNKYIFEVQGWRIKHCYILSNPFVYLLVLWYILWILLGTLNMN